MELNEILGLKTYQSDIYIGEGPQYPWGGLYGGQIVAQALRATSATVPIALSVHSLRAYFIRRGDPGQPVQYDVERIRDGKSFSTRRVMARQAGGVILNLEASFQREETSIDFHPRQMPLHIPKPEDLLDDSWSPLFERRWVPSDGRAMAWVRVRTGIGSNQLLQRCMLAYISDDFPGDAAVKIHPLGRETEQVRDESMFLASLDHSIWFHRPVRTDEWHLYDFTCHSFVGGRGLTIGHVFGGDGSHVATVAQELLLRDNRER